MSKKENLINELENTIEMIKVSKERMDVLEETILTLREIIKLKDERIAILEGHIEKLNQLLNNSNTKD